MGKEIVSQVQESQRVPSRINPKGNTLRHIVIKLTKIKDRVIRSNKGKMTSNIQGNSHQLISQQKLYKPEENGMIYLKG